MKFDSFKKVKEITTAKSSKKIEEFGEVYSSILVGMHSDINQYKRQVEVVQNLVASTEAQFKTGLRKVDEAYLEIKQDKQKIGESQKHIEEVHVEMKKLFKSFSLTADEISAFKQKVESINEAVESQQRELKSVLNATTELRVITTKQEETIKLYKTVLFIVTAVVVLLLFFAIYTY